MAKNKRKFRGFGMLPGLSTLKNEVKPLDVVAGLGLGFVGVVAAKWARAKWMPQLDVKVPNYILSITPVVGGLVAGLASFATCKYLGKTTRGSGHLIGASLAGLALTADVLIRDNLSKSSPATATSPEKKALLPFYNGIEDFGALVPDATFSGLQQDYGRLTQDSGYAGLQEDYRGMNEIEDAIAG